MKLLTVTVRISKINLEQALTVLEENEVPKINNCDNVCIIKISVGQALT